MNKKPPRYKPIEWEVDQNGCWCCTSHNSNKTTRPKLEKNKKHYLISRYIYEQCFGEIKNGNVIRHTCDNVKCINPEHLIQGTQAENVNDMIERRRTSHGTKHPSAKLTEKQVIEIRTKRMNGKKLKDLAEEYKICIQLVSNIINKKVWRHV